MEATYDCITKVATDAKLHVLIRAKAIDVYERAGEFFDENLNGNAVLPGSDLAEFLKQIDDKEKYQMQQVNDYVSSANGNL
jgi:hypothetical protein